MIINRVVALTVCAIGMNSAQAIIHCGTATVDVGGAYSKQGYCYDDGVPDFPGPSGPPGGGSAPPTGGGSAPGSYPTIDAQMHAMNCAAAYGAYKPKVDVVTTFSSEWGWAIDALNLKEETATSTPPSPVGGHAWIMLDADTMYIGEPSETTVLYMPAYSTRGNVIATLEHEFAHQQGVLDESTPEAAGQAARLAYLADHGAKCGGI